MSTIETQTSRWTQKQRVGIWLFFVVLWTTGLLAPISSKTWSVDELVMGKKFLVFKTIHVFGYAIFAFLTGWLRIPVRYRWLSMYFLMFHATLTEVIQLTVKVRSGWVVDVFFDHLGVALGVLLSWPWWWAPDPIPSTVTDQAQVQEPS